MTSLTQSSISRLRHLACESLVTARLRDLKTRTAYLTNREVLGQPIRKPPFGKKPDQLALNRLCDVGAVSDIQSPQHQLFDVKVDIHHQPAISESVRGFSILAYSVLAACK